MSHRDTHTNVYCNTFGSLVAFLFVLKLYVSHMDDCRSIFPRTLPQHIHEEDVNVSTRWLSLLSLSRARSRHNDNIVQIRDVAYFVLYVQIFVNRWN